MHLVTQNRKSGELAVSQVPQPVLRPGGILVRTHASLISSGTERTTLELGQKSLLGKARERPDLVQRTLDKLRRDGLVATLNAVRDQLDRLLPLGYSACGDVQEVGGRVNGFQVGEPVACAGAGYACHGEVNYIPQLLAAKLPAGVSYEAGAYTTVGTIALQGVRNADVRVGETVVVLGLGLIGQLSVQLLKAAGCQVVALDVSQERAKLAVQGGAEVSLLTSDTTVESAVADLTRGRGADAVLITAATKSNEPVEVAARLARDRARVVMVGVTGMDLPRRDYFFKELQFVVSRSYGPGRYDAEYEEHGHDYPAGYVRWTENRNMEAFLDLLAAGKIRPELCTTHCFDIEDAADAYELILSGDEPHLGVVLQYPTTMVTASGPEPGRIEVGNGKRGGQTHFSATADSDQQADSDRKMSQTPTCEGLRNDGRSSAHRARVGKQSVGISFIGAGNFARGVLLRHLIRIPQVKLQGIMSASGVSALSAAKRFGFDFCASDPQEVIEDDRTDCVFIATQHSQHAELVCQALRADKHVFVEKPLAISLDELYRVSAASENTSRLLLIGFNRRFAPLSLKLKEHFRGTGKLHISYRCNAGTLTPGSWHSDPAEGGRIIGEACHFIDFCSFLTDSRPASVFAMGGGVPGQDDSAGITLELEDGSMAQILYTAEGSSRQGKEQVEVFGAGRSAKLQDYRRLELYDARKTRHSGGWFGQDKGHRAELEAWLKALRGQHETPIASESLIDTTLASMAAVESQRTRQVVQLQMLRERMLRESEITT